MQLDPIGVLFSNSWRRYQERFGTIVPIFLLPLAIIGIGELLVTRQALPALALGGILNLLGAVISIVASTAMLAAIGNQEDILAAYQTGFKLFWASIWITILSTLAYFGGFVLLIIPGIILGVQLAFVQYVLVLEHKNGMAALAQSRAYVKGHWWAFVGRTFLLGLVFGAVMLIIYLPFKLLVGGVAAGLIYGILLLFFIPFSVSYSYEIFDNLRRLKPDAAEVAAKTEMGFLKVCMALGVVGIIGAIMLVFAALIFLPAVIMKEATANPDGYSYPYPPAIGTSTLPGEAHTQISPMSGPMGTKVTLSGVIFEATNTVLMKGLVAVRDVAPVAGGTLTFTVPGSLAPNCDPRQICPQFLLTVTPGDYEIAVMNSQGTLSVGTFTVEASALK